MERDFSKQQGRQSHPTDHGPEFFVGSVPAAAQCNQTFRTAFWTGQHLQMTLMCIPVCGEIGAEMHPDTDQVIRIEAGQALVQMGQEQDKMEVRRCLRAGEAVFVPGGTWHNISNNGPCPLKLSSIYGPPQHPWGTVHLSKEDAQAQEA